jgi:hypothetical protein
LRSSGFPQNYKNKQTLQLSRKTEETSRANFMPSSLQPRLFELVVGQLIRKWTKHKNRVKKFEA